MSQTRHLKFKRDKITLHQIKFSQNFQFTLSFYKLKFNNIFKTLLKNVINKYNKRNSIRLRELI